MTKRPRWRDIKRSRKTYETQKEALILDVYCTERGDSVCQRPQSLPIHMKTMILTRLTKNTTWHLTLNPGLELLQRHKSIIEKKGKKAIEHITEKQIQCFVTTKMLMYTRKPKWHLHLNPGVHTQTQTHALSLSLYHIHSKKIKQRHNEWSCKYIKTHPDNKTFSEHCSEQIISSVMIP